MVMGLPLHPLAVHFAVAVGMVAPVAALVAVLLPRFRTWFGWGLPALAVLGAIVLRLTVSFGDMLEDSDPAYDTPAVDTHSDWGELAGNAGTVLALAAVLLWLTTSPTARRRWTSRWPSWLTLLAQVATALASIATLVLTVLAGHTGASAVWGG